jgi:hypothetical protein
VVRSLAIVSSERPHTMGSLAIVSSERPHTMGSLAIVSSERPHTMGSLAIVFSERLHTTMVKKVIMVIVVTMGGDLQPGCLADRLLTGLGQPQINP